MESVEFVNAKQNALSQRARAFSVEALLRRDRTEETSTKDMSSVVPPKERRIDVRHDNVKVELVNRSLWVQFHRLENEMIITKAGRRIFPCLKFDIFNLIPDAYYLIWMDIVPVDRHRYRYAFPNSSWMIAGKCESHSGIIRYVHPDGVARGRHWMTQSVAFDKVKLTNNKECKQKGQIVLNSMHKYQPRLHIQLVDGSNRQDGLPHESNSLHFQFAETSFIAVTAYQNQQITNLKIRSNPFAKGFRDAIKIRNINHSRSDTKEEVSFPCTAVNIFPPDDILGIDSVPGDAFRCLHFPWCGLCGCHDSFTVKERYLRENAIRVVLPHFSHACRIHAPCK